MTPDERAPASEAAGALQEDLGKDSGKEGTGKGGVGVGPAREAAGPSAVAPTDEHVPIALSMSITERAIGTDQGDTSSTGHQPDDVEPSAMECERGIGVLLRDKVYPTDGRDAQVPCKVRSCTVCGPIKQGRKLRRIMEDFDGEKMHAVEVNDGDEWEAMHKAIERAGELFHRVPAPGGKAVILTTADVGDIVQDPAEYVRKVIEQQPCYTDDKRRMTSSRQWKGAGDSSNGRWKSEGTSPLPQRERVKAYEEMGAEPKEVLPGYRSPDVLRAYDLKLPLPDTPEMEELAERIQLRRRDDEVELDEDGWPVSRQAKPPSGELRLDHRDAGS